LKALGRLRAPVAERELDDPTVLTLLKLIWHTAGRLVRDPVGVLIGSAFLVIMLWGEHGELDLLGAVWSGWQGPGSDPDVRATIIPGVAWDQEWISFWAGALLLVGVPLLIIIFVFRQSPRDYGLGLPRRNRRRLTAISAVLLLVVSAPAFWFAADVDSMRQTYPLYRGRFDGDAEFFVYELGYLPFFLAIEFIFRGYLLFGLYRFRDRDVGGGVRGAPGPLVFGYYAILISMLSYTAWHLGKPLPELWGTLIWGLLAGTIALGTGTIWHLVIVHWLLNVLLDYAIYAGM
jgi:hypothetical protein